MKTTIFYFSGTGNSLAICKTIQEQLEDVQLLKVNRQLLDRTITITSDVIGFVYPIYIHRPPNLLLEVIENISVTSNPYIFSICSHNGEPGYAPIILDKVLKRKGLSIVYSDAILYPGNSIAVPGYTNTPQEQQRRLNLSKLELQRVTDNILGRVEMDNVKKLSKVRIPKSILMNFVYKRLLKPYRQFRTNDRCNLCKNCISLCPVDNITLMNREISWGDTCEHCLAYIHLCPNRASMVKQDDVDSIRYKHPEITLKELKNESSYIN